MKKILSISLTFLIPALIVMLFWVLIYDSILIFLSISFPQGIIMGISYLLLDLFIIKKIKLNIWVTRIIVFLILFILIIIIDFTITFKGVIEPIKSIFNHKFPYPAGLK